MPSVPLGGVAASLGSALGKGVAQPFEEGLNLLAQKKLMQIQQQQQQQASQAERNRIQETILPLFQRRLPPEAAQQVAQLYANSNEKQQEAILNNIGSFGQLFAGQQQRMPAQQETPTVEAIQQLRQLQNPMNVANFMGLTGSQGQPLQQQQGMQQPQNGMEALRQMSPQQQQLSNEEFDEALRDIFTSPHQRLEKEKFDLKKQELNLKETRKLREEIQGKRRGAREDLRVIKEMQSLNKTGKLDNPFYVKGLEAFGLDDVGALLNPESQQYQKFEKFFLKNLKNLFPGRVTQLEMQNYLKAIPTLMNSEEGRERILQDMELVARASQLEGKILDQIMEETKNNPDISLAGELEKRMEPKLEKLYSKMSFSRDTKKTVATVEEAVKSGAKRVRDTETGKIYRIVNGQPVEEK